jgi:hypothetical protein
METVADAAFRFFEPNWLEELSGGDANLIKNIMNSLTRHMPELIKEIQSSVNQGNKRLLFEQISRANYVANLFTKQDLLKRWDAVVNLETETITTNETAQARYFLSDLHVLLKEVRAYQSTTLDSHFGINIPINVRNN